MADDPKNVGRRTALKLIAGAAAVPAVANADIPQEQRAPRTPTDPDLLQPEVPWDFVLTDAELATARVLCDVIIPADAQGPSATDVGAADFVNEWVSAPYESNTRDLVTVRGGLAWLNTEGTKRFGQPFASLSREQHHQICDDINLEAEATEEFEAAARFFNLFRNLTATAYYTTFDGMRDLGYVGNQALPRFDGPPPEVLRHIGLE